MHALLGCTVQILNAETCRQARAMLTPDARSPKALLVKHNATLGPASSRAAAGSLSHSASHVGLSALCSSTGSWWKTIKEHLTEAGAGAANQDPAIQC